MKALAVLQRDFLAMLEEELPPEDARLALYHHNTRAARLAALSAAFPVVRRLVGEAFFAQAALAYGRAHPSRSGDLNRFGAHWARFLEGYPHAAGLGYLPDVARLEWALHQSHDAADAGPFDFGALSRVPPERFGELRLRLHPAVRLLHSSHPILAIWEANQPGRDGTLEADGGPDYVLVHLTQDGPRAEGIPALSWRFLDDLSRGSALGELCDRLGDEAGQLDELLARFAACGVICAFDPA